MRGGWRGLVLGTLVLFGAWAGAHLYRASHPLPTAIAVPAGMASSPGPRDADAIESAPAVRIPEHVPQFALADLRGHVTPVSTWAGKPLMLNFWATWCAPCRREIPLLQSLASEWAKDELVIVGIAIDHPDKVQKFVDEYHIGYPILVGEQEALDAAEKLGVESPALPFTVFIDRQGQVLTLFVGELHPSQAKLILSVMRQLDTHALDLRPARQKIAVGLQSLSPG